MKDITEEGPFERFEDRFDPVKRELAAQELDDMAKQERAHALHKRKRDDVVGEAQRVGERPLTPRAPDHDQHSAGSADDMASTTMITLRQPRHRSQPLPPSQTPECEPIDLRRVVTPVSGNRAKRARTTSRGPSARARESGGIVGPAHFLSSVR